MDVEIDCEIDRAIDSEDDCEVDRAIDSDIDLTRLIARSIAGSLVRSTVVSTVDSECNAAVLLLFRCSQSCMERCPSSMIDRAHIVRPLVSLPSDVAWARQGLRLPGHRTHELHVARWTRARARAWFRRTTMPEVAAMGMASRSHDAEGLVAALQDR
eukprot:5834736-Pyramimonas_sp.AAC.1